MTDPVRGRGTAATRRVLPPPGSPRLGLALAFRVGLLAVLVWLTGVCVAGRQWGWLVAAVILTGLQAVLLGVFIWAARTSYGGLLSALRRRR